MPSTRITFRLTPALEPLVADRVRQGTPLSDIIRTALEQYFGVRPQVSDTTSDIMSDRAELSDTLSDKLSDIQTRLVALETRAEAPVPTVSPRPTPRPTDRPTAPETPESPVSLPPHIVSIAEVAAEYDKLSLAELARLLFERHIYRATDRQGAAVPVNRGTLKKWLDQARAAGAL